jgi:putative NIF3 family GTP cyclohydrolase 1 type 2
MKRRKFLSVSGSVVFGSTLLSQDGLGRNRSPSLKAIDVHNALRSLCDVSEPSVDRIIIGGPETVVTKIGTCWMPDWNTLKRAVEQGINTVVVHEPTFYDHWDSYDKRSISWEAPETAKDVYYTAIERKRRWIEERGLVIIRCHDVLDKVPEFGIPYALGQALGFPNRTIIRSRPYFNVYEIDAAPAIDVAQRIAAKLKSVGQPGVAFYGDPQRSVQSVGLGTGCISNPIEFMDLNPDLYISIDDVVRTWIQTTFADDTGQPLVIINHGTSEEFGMRSLNDRLKSMFTDYDVIHLEQGCGYTWVGA